MAKENYRVKPGYEGQGVYIFGDCFVLDADLSQSKLKKLFKAGITKPIICEYSEEKAKKSESEESKED